MFRSRNSGARWLLCAALLAGAACSSDADNTDAGTGDAGDGAPLSCTQAAPDALRSCIAGFGDELLRCYAEDNTACADDDSGTGAVLDALEADVRRSCVDGGFGALSLDGLVGRLRNACASESSSLAWRVHGGPQGAVWRDADDDTRGCLSAAHAGGAALIDASLDAINTCLAQDTCDAGELDTERQALAEASAGELDGSCPGLADLIAVDAATFAQRAVDQVDCITATGHVDTRDLALGCGPSSAEFEAPRGEYKQIVVDGDRWGTLCGDGSPYAFQVRLAPEGEPLDRVLIGLQGGGVCVFEEDCVARFDSSPDLFNAMDDEALGSGIASDDPDESPFANWTKVYLPYCNQDVFAGGGATETLGPLELPRHGGVNLRAAVRMVRDVLWRMMDEEGGDGFRPDEVVALFGGWSAGAYGTLYNYHWMLDDLQWPRTIAFPDAGLALDNGEALGVRGLGLGKLGPWGTLPNLPPYCFDGGCAVGSVLLEALSPRLLTVPEQQMLLLSNPVDDTQQGDAFFNDQVTWINTMRQTYCDTHELPGVHYYLTSVSDESIHVVSLRPDLYAGEVDGESMRDWFEHAVNDPSTLQSRVEEADFVSAVPGVEPYPCDVPL